MSEFIKYRSKRNKSTSQNKSVAQNVVAQKERYPVIRSRVSVELKSRILEVAEEKGLSVSEMTRLLWEDYLEKKFQKEWQEEVSTY
jgi:post-segregation antitoxin (ccd killing protein)